MHDHVGALDESRTLSGSVVALAVLGLPPAVLGGVERPARHSDDALDRARALQSADDTDAEVARRARNGNGQATCRHGRVLPHSSAPAGGRAPWARDVMAADDVRRVDERRVPSSPQTTRSRRPSRAFTVSSPLPASIESLALPPEIRSFASPVRMRSRPPPPWTSMTPPLPVTTSSPPPARIVAVPPSALIDPRPSRRRRSRRRGSRRCGRGRRRRRGGPARTARRACHPAEHGSSPAPA